MNTQEIGTQITAAQRGMKLCHLVKFMNSFHNNKANFAGCNKGDMVWDLVNYVETGVKKYHGRTSKLLSNADKQKNLDGLLIILRKNREISEELDAAEAVKQRKRMKFLHAEEREIQKKRTRYHQDLIQALKGTDLEKRIKEMDPWSSFTTDEILKMANQYNKPCAGCRAMKDTAK